MKWCFFSTSFLHTSFLVRLRFSRKRLHLRCRTGTLSGMYGMFIDTTQISWSFGTGCCLLPSWEQVSSLFLPSRNVFHEVEGGRQCGPALMLLCSQGTVKRRAPVKMKSVPRAELGPAKLSWKEHSKMVGKATVTCRTHLQHIGVVERAV